MHSGQEEEKMLIKAGVSIARLERHTRRSLPVVEEVLQKDGEELIITATDDGNHGAGSLHYGDQAYDIRLPQHDPVGRLADMKKALGKDFDVIGEDDHIHIEYDPK